MRRFITFTIGVILLTSCGSSDSWTGFVAKGIPQAYESYNDLVFTENLTGYLGGSRQILLGEVNKQYKFIDKTVLYKTKDQGKSWVKIPLDYNNSVDRIFAFNDTLVVLLRNVTSDSIYILKSGNYGKNWERLFCAPKDVYISDIQFKTADSGLVIVYDRNKFVLLKVSLNKIDTIRILESNNHDFKIANNNVFSLMPDKTAGISLGVLITDTKTGENKELVFDKPYFVTSSTKNDNGLILAVRDENTGKILRVTERGISSYDFGQYSDYIPDQIFAYEKTIVAIANRNQDVAFLGVVHHLLLSKDYGNTWTVEKIPLPMYLKPVTMYKDLFFMAYSGEGLIQKRNLMQ